MNVLKRTLQRCEAPQRFDRRPPIRVRSYCVAANVALLVQIRPVSVIWRLCLIHGCL